LTGARVEWRYPGEVVINQHAEQISDELYKLVWKENEGLIPVIFDELTVGWLNADGIELRRLAGDGIGHHFQGGLIPLKERDGKWAFIDLDENWVFEPEYDVVDFLAPSRLMLGHYRNNSPDDSPVVYLADLTAARIGETSGSLILPFDEDGIACIWRPNDTSEFGAEDKNYIDLDGNILLSKWL
jgi:hypothetical protein